MGKQAIEGATRINYFAVDPEDLVLVTDRNHPLWDERVDLPVREDLVLSIMQPGVGVLEAIQVVKDGDKLLVADGRQRTKAAIEANKRLKKSNLDPIKIHCYPRRGDDHELMGVMIDANEHRTEDTILIKAKKANRYMATGRSEAEASVRFGVSVSTIKAWVKLLDASPAVKKAVDTGKISANEARKVAELPREEQDKALAAAEEKGTSVRHEAHARGAKTKEARTGASRAEVRKILAAAKAETGLLFTDRETALLRWFAGEIGERGLADGFPAAAEALKAEPKKKAA